MLNRLLLYVHDPDAVAEFYVRHFGFVRRDVPGDRLVELLPADDHGAIILLHPAAKGQKPGQVLVNLVFDVNNVADFCARARQKGLDFGPVHRGDGYEFANGKDPAGNAISVSSRAFRSSV